MTRIVNGVELQESKLRDGTKCKCCGKKITDGNYIQTYTKSCGVAYVCKDCIKHRSYGSDLVGRKLIDGKLTSGNYRFAIELEANYFAGTNIQAIDAYLAAQWGLQPSQDCTVDVEYHMTNKVNFHGLKDFLQDIGEIVDMSASNCGQHINISKLDWTMQDMDKIRQNARELFNPLADEMKNDVIGTTQIFGRYFTHYASCDNYFQHGSWLNLDNPYHIEFRLPHYQNANQFFYCANFCRACVDILDKWLHGYYTTTKASQNMTKEFRKYVAGKATCQRSERNKVER